MTIHLYNREEMGLVHQHGDVHTFAIVIPNPSRRLRRAVALLNAYADCPLADNVTYEDRPVTKALWLMRLAVVLFGSVPLAAALYPIIGWLLALTVAAIITVVGVRGCEWFLGETLTELMASHLLGVPARPMQYITTAGHHGQVVYLVNGHPVDNHPHFVARV